jgi:predicted HAD superfamily Cof-like phosphohydrolase
MQPLDAMLAVREFHQQVGAPIADTPALLPCDATDAQELANQVTELGRTALELSRDDDVLLSRTAMMLEELAEWLDAHAAGDLIAAADAWADRAYLLYGDAVATGLPAAELFAEVHSSNLTKQIVTDGSGKGIKGSGFHPPDVHGVLERRSG